MQRPCSQTESTEIELAKVRRNLNGKAIEVKSCQEEVAALS